MEFRVGGTMDGTVAGPHRIIRLSCGRCGDVPSATSQLIEDGEVPTVRPTCPRCGGEVQIYLRAGL